MESPFRTLGNLGFMKPMKNGTAQQFLVKDFNIQFQQQPWNGLWDAWKSPL